MRIPKAIEILKACIDDQYPLDIQDYKDATQLGIEALREVQKTSLSNPALQRQLLPGETEGQAEEDMP